jgi:hypothetical protein
VKIDMRSPKERVSLDICLLISRRKAWRLARKENFSARKLVQLCAQGFLLGKPNSELCEPGSVGECQIFLCSGRSHQDLMAAWVKRSE